VTLLLCPIEEFDPFPPPFLPPLPASSVHLYPQTQSISCVVFFSSLFPFFSLPPESLQTDGFPLLRVVKKSNGAGTFFSCNKNMNFCLFSPLQRTCGDFPSFRQTMPRLSSEVVGIEDSFIKQPPLFSKSPVATFSPLFFEAPPPVRLGHLRLVFFPPAYEILLSLKRNLVLPQPQIHFTTLRNLANIQKFSFFSPIAPAAFFPSLKINPHFFDAPTTLARLL